MKRFNIKIPLVFLCFLLAFAACQVSGPKQKRNSEKPRAQVSDKPKIVAFGDSLTAGFGLQERESYPYLLQEKIKADGFEYEVINAGVSGDTSAGGLERIDWSLDQENVQILILELGGNDLLRGLSHLEMKKNLAAIIKKAQAKNVKVLFCGLFPPDAPVNDDQRNYGKVFAELAKEFKLPYIPFFLEGVGGVKKYNQADGIHPNAEGEKIITETVYRSLKPMLKKP